MTLATQLSAAFTRVGTEFKTVRSEILTKVGDLTSLTTTTKSSTVAAINELKASISGAGAVINDTTPSSSTVYSSTKVESIATGKVPTTRQINGHALSADLTLAWSDFTGLLPTSALPPLAINETFTPANQAAMIALTAQRGDMAIRTDNGLTYVLSTDSPSTLADWKQITAAGSVTAVAGKTGNVSLVVADVSGAQDSSLIGDTTHDFAGDFTAALV